MNNAFPLVALLVSVGLFVWYVNPVWSTAVPDLQTQLAEVDRALGSAGEFEDKLAAYEERISQVSPERRDRLENLIPNAVDNVRIILDVGGVAQQVGVSITDIDVAPAVESGGATGAVVPPEGQGGQGIVVAKEDYQSLTVELSARGNYQSVKDFVSVLERSLRLIDVTSMTLTRGETGVFTLKLQFRVYWLSAQE